MWELILSQKNLITALPIWIRISYVITKQNNCLDKLNLNQLESYN